jgi:hypothetical protein
MILDIILDIIRGHVIFFQLKLLPNVTRQFAASGIRLTKQREEVFAMLLQNKDHPTAAELFLRRRLEFTRRFRRFPGRSIVKRPLPEV